MNSVVEKRTRIAQQELMTARALILAAAIGLAGCSRAAPIAQASVDTRNEAKLDSALARLCVSPPDTSVRGTGGCVLRDQSPVIGPRKAPPR